MGIPELLEGVNRVNPALLAFYVISVLALAVFLFGFPREAVMVFSGYQFGLLIGLLINQIGLFIGAGLGYIIGKRGRLKVENTKKTVYIRYHKAFEEKGIKALTALRLTPFSPQDTISMVSGFLRINQKSYFLISFLSFLPYALFWSFVGQNFFDQMISIIPTDYNIEIWLYSLLAFLVIISIFARFFLNFPNDEEHSVEPQLTRSI
ncbi:MAG: TVP38/TMEM64 family protein [Candidatus Heimdallarchaeota archaeon]